MGQGKILIVDDDRSLLQVLKIRVESKGYEVMVAEKEKDALKVAQIEDLDLSIVDLQLARGDGISLMKDLHLILPDMPVIILTAFGTIESAVRAMKDGAYGYLTKPFNPRDLLSHIERALEHRRLTSEISQVKGILEKQIDFPEMVIKSDKMRRVLSVVARIAPSDSTVFINGESGTGKELIAKAIHLASPRREKHFVALNCAALPEPLLESTLFGHKKGAFTGAVESTKGLFAQANGGTLFLDEVGDLAMSIQSRLLRVLQEHQFYPLGSEKLREVDVRMVVATNKNLEEEVSKGTFRSDLFYRIHVIPIYLPPLRERKEDIPLLVEHFLKKLTLSINREMKGITPGAMKKLMLHNWPGNIRELQNTLECAAAIAPSNVITEDLILRQRTRPGQEGAAEQPIRSLRQAKDAFERDYLINLLHSCRGNVNEAANLAGKYRADLYNILKKHRLNPGDFRSRAYETGH